MREAVLDPPKQRADLPAHGPQLLRDLAAQRHLRPLARLDAPARQAPECILQVAAEQDAAIAQHNGGGAGYHGFRRQLSGQFGPPRDR
jgi:hypothetical protein